MSSPDIQNDGRKTDDFDELSNFLQCYFHQDWSVDSETADDVVALFLVGNRSAKELRTIADQIRQFVDMHGDDITIERALFTELGCYYMPSGDNRSATAWLEVVRSMMLNAADSAESSTSDTQEG
jgi:hypothetical protein